MKEYKILGHLTFLILFVFAAFFCFERTIYNDSCFQLFKIINFHTFNFELGRYSIILSQLIQFIPIKLGLSLKTIVYTYSFSFFILFYIFYILNTRILKNEAAGLIIIFIIIGVRHTFFHTVSETWQALVFASCLYAWLNYEIAIKNKILNKLIFYGVAFLLILLCLFMHPASIFPASFIIAYYIIDKGVWNKIQYYILILGSLIISLLKYLSITENSYEGDFFSGLRPIDLAKNFFHLYSTKFPFHHLDIYIIPALLFTSVILYYSLHKKWLKLGFYSLSVIGLSIINCIIFYKGDCDMLMERSFIPIIFIITIPFANEIIFGSKKHGLIKIIVCAAILAYCFWGIFSTGGIYKERITYMHQFLSETKELPEKKYIIASNLIDNEKLIVNWAFSFESLMLSSIDNPNNAQTIYILKDSTTLKLDYTDPKLFLAADFWLNWNLNQLDKKWFNLPESNGYRKILTSSDFSK